MSREKQNNFSKYVYEYVLFLEKVHKKSSEIEIKKIFYFASVSFEIDKFKRKQRELLIKTKNFQVILIKYLNNK